jgi:hypothetical protein
MWGGRKEEMRDHDVAAASIAYGGYKRFGMLAVS